MKLEEKLKKLADCADALGVDTYIIHVGERGGTGELQHGMSICEGEVLHLAALTLQFIRVRKQIAKGMQCISEAEEQLGEGMATSRRIDLSAVDGREGRQ